MQSSNTGVGALASQQHAKFRPQTNPNSAFSSYNSKQIGTSSGLPTANEDNSFIEQHAHHEEEEKCSNTMVSGATAIAITTPTNHQRNQNGNQNNLRITSKQRSSNERLVG